MLLNVLGTTFLSFYCFDDFKIEDRRPINI